MSVSVSGLKIEYSRPGVDRGEVKALLDRYRTDEPVHIVFIGTKPEIGLTAHAPRKPFAKQLTALRVGFKCVLPIKKSAHLNRNSRALFVRRSQQRCFSVNRTKF